MARDTAGQRAVGVAGAEIVEGGAVRLSVIMITKNEARRIEASLASVAFADEIVVVDSDSSDGTVELARQHGARVTVTSDWPGFGRQKQRALDAARGRWVLCLDADEVVDAALAQAIQAIVRLPDAASDALPAYECARMSAFCGQWMRASGWYPDRTVRLVQRGHARFSSDLVHEQLIVEGAVGRLDGLLLHDSIPDLSNAIDKMNRYSSGRALDLLAAGRRGGLGSALAHGLWAFVRTFVLRRGFLDGRLGLVLAIHNAETTYYRYLKMWLGNAPRTPPPPPTRSP